MNDASGINDTSTDYLLMMAGEDGQSTFPFVFSSPERAQAYAQRHSEVTYDPELGRALALQRWDTPGTILPELLGVYAMTSYSGVHYWAVPAVRDPLHPLPTGLAG